MRWSRTLTWVSVVVAVVAAGVVVGSTGARASVEVHLAAAGDFGARSSTASVLGELAQLNPDAFLGLGDLAYEDVPDEPSWCNYVKGKVGEGFPFELVSGNHESNDVLNGEINNFSACLPNQVPGVAGTYGREYYMDLPRNAPLVRVIQASPNLTFSDGKWVYAKGDAHYQWLSAAIDGGRAKGAKWIIVTSHEPCWSVGIYNCPSASKDFYDLLVAKKVDLVLHGHEHAYMRTNQLRSGTTGCPVIPAGSFDADCVADSDGAFSAGAGTVFATVGTGGTPQRDVNDADSEAGYFSAWAGLNKNQTFGLLDLHLSETQLSAQFVPTSGGNFTDSFTITQGAPPPNTPPTASFTSSVQGLGASFDGRASSDPDGTVASWAWDFGDGTQGTGSTAQHTYAAAGTYPVTLVVTDDQGATGTTSASVTVAQPPPNLPPTASFTSSAQGLGVSVDGSASSDPDGTIAAWAWNFGDGTQATGRTAQHTYAASGTYTVSLTVTDDRGATAATSTPVTVTAPPVTDYAADTFSRVVSNGWGTADTGGPWSVSGTTSGFSVTGGAGRMSTTPSSARTAWLNGVSRSSLEVDSKLSLDKAQTGNGSYLAVLGRRVNASNDYRFKLRVAPNGTVTAQLVRTVAGSETVIQNVNAVPGLSYAAGDVLRTRFQVSGTGTTVLAAKVWKDGTAEPATWLLQGTDTTASLQVPGAVGLWFYLSGSATVSPMTLSVDDLVATPVP